MGRRTRKGKTNEQIPEAGEWVFFGVNIRFTVWLVMICVAAALPSWRLWGLHFPAFLPFWVQILFFGSALVILLLPGKQWSKLIGSVPRPLTRILRSPLSAIILVAAFYVFRVSAALLGDGTVRGQEAQQGAFWPSKILSGYLATLAYDIFHPVLGYTGQDAVAMVSFLAGGVFALLVWYFPLRIWKNPKDRMIARLVLILSAPTALFFGYIELYALPCIAVIGFLLGAEAYRRGRSPFYVAAFFLVLAAASHFATVVLFPALVVLALTHTKRGHGPAATVGIIGLLIGVWGYIAYFGDIFTREAAAGSMLLPVFGTPPLTYGLISPAHIVDLANLALFVCPGLLIAIPLIKTGKTSRQKTGSGTFWLLAVTIPLCIPLFLDPKLGMARDWDLMTIGLIPLVVFVAVYLADRRASLPRGAIRLPVFASAAVLVMFVGINSQLPSAISRYEKLLEMDEERGGYGYEILAMWYQEQGDIENEIRHWENALRLEQNKRYWLNLSVAYILNEDRRKGYDAARRAHALDTNWARGVFYLGFVFNEMQMPDSAIVYYNSAVRLDSNDHVLRHTLGLLLHQQGRLDEAREQMAAAVRLSPDNPSYLMALAEILIRSDLLADAEPVLKRAIQLKPGNIPNRMKLVSLYRKTQRPQRALNDLARLRQLHGLNRKERAQIESMEKLIREGGAAVDSAG